MKWYFKVLSNYATFSGRARRKEYWMFNLVNFLIVLFFVALIANSMVRQVSDTSEVKDKDFLYSVLILVLYIFIIFLPSLAVTVRRLHDINKSGWLVLIYFVSAIIADSLVKTITTWTVTTSLIVLILNIPTIYFIVLMAKEGTVGDNRFGPDSKERADTGTTALL